ncbi:MAG: flagellar basal body-associated FliL family protein [Deltaproteobacteria bacterium]|nr:flagellar basal body-associated FliL family protein [Deltaproteobacteria bacterium]
MENQISEIPVEVIQEEGLVPARSSFKKWLILGGGVLILLVSGLGVAAFFFPEALPGPLALFADPPAQDPQGVRKDQRSKEEHGFIYNMDPFIVNLADTDQSRYLKIRLNLEGNGREQNEEYAKRLPQIKDTVLAILSKKTHQELLDSTGKEKLKTEILNHLNPKMAGFQFKAVYYTEFVIQ